MILRVLHPKKEIPLFHIAWQWRESYPRRVRGWDMVKSFEQWLEMMQRRVSIGLFDPCLTALMTLQPTDENVYEAHVDCKRGVDLKTLQTVLLSIERTVFEEWEATEVFAGVISRNYGIIRVARACGYLPDGISEQVGKLRFIRLRKTRDEFYKNQYRIGINDQHIHASAGGIIPGYRRAEEHAISG